MKFIDFFAGIGGFRRGRSWQDMNVSDSASSTSLRLQVHIHAFTHTRAERVPG